MIVALIVVSVSLTLLFALIILDDICTNIERRKPTKTLPQENTPIFKHKNQKTDTAVFTQFQPSYEHIDIKTLAYFVAGSAFNYDGKIRRWKQLRRRELGLKRHGRFDDDNYDLSTSEMVQMRNAQLRGEQNVWRRSAEALARRQPSASDED